MDTTVVAYSVYLLLAIGLTVWVAQTISRAGKVFLIDVFQGNNELAGSINHLLVVGFYLLNLGFVALFMKLSGSVAGSRGVFETVALKVGTVLLVLGTLHLFNLYVLNKFRRRGTIDSRRPASVPPMMMPAMSHPHLAPSGQQLPPTTPQR